MNSNRVKVTKEKLMSVEENENEIEGEIESDRHYEGDSNHNSYNEEDTMNNKPLLNKRKISLGSGILHILPIQFPIDNYKTNTIKTHVDAYFESYILLNEIKSKNAIDYCDHTSIFRGHPLNGKKYSNTSSITYCQLYPSFSSTTQLPSTYDVNQSYSISSYFLWQYDERYLCENPLSKINQTLSKLDILS